MCSSLLRTSLVGGRRHLQMECIAGRLYSMLIHRLYTRWTDLEVARIDHANQVEDLLPAGELGREEGRMVVMELASSEPAIPSAWTVIDGITVLVVDELRACGDGIFKQQVAGR